MTITYKFSRYPDESVIPNVVGKYVDNKQKMSIPFDNDNTDYQEYLEWVAAGNTAD